MSSEAAAFRKALVVALDRHFSDNHGRHRYHFFDRARKGRISTTDFRAVVERLGLPGSQNRSVVDQVFAAADTNGDGGLDFSEFIQAFTNRPNGQAVLRPASARPFSGSSGPRGQGGADVWKRPVTAAAARGERPPSSSWGGSGREAGGSFPAPSSRPESARPSSGGSGREAACAFPASSSRPGSAGYAAVGAGEGGGTGPHRPATGREGTGSTEARVALVAGALSEKLARKTKSMRKAFRLFDHTADGHVNAAELEKAVRDLNIPASREDIGSIMAAYGRAGEDSMDYSGFMKAFMQPTRAHTPMHLAPPPEQRRPITRDERDRLAEDGVFKSSMVLVLPRGARWHGAHPPGQRR